MWQMLPGIHPFFFLLTQMRNQATDEAPVKFKVKLSGDGAKMSRLTGFVIISFAILNDEDAVMSSKGLISFISFWSAIPVLLVKVKKKKETSDTSNN